MTEEIKSEVTGGSYFRGTLTIRVPETLATIYMPEIVKQFHTANPGVKLIFINCSDRQLKEELNSGRIDLAFLMTDAIHFNDINVQLLKTENIVLVSGPTHTLARRKTATFKEIGEQTILFPKTD
jgi:DNA-binding transcriptional LysR family regulator